MPLSWCSFHSSTPELVACSSRIGSRPGTFNDRRFQTGQVILLPDPLVSQSHSALQADRWVVQHLIERLDVDILPAALSQRTPGWSGLARRAFDVRREQLLGDVRRAEAALQQLCGELAAAEYARRSAP
jgi:hypothetical protein